MQPGHNLKVSKHSDHIEGGRRTYMCNAATELDTGEYAGGMQGCTPTLLFHALEYHVSCPFPVAYQSHLALAQESREALLCHFYSIASNYSSYVKHDRIEGNNKDRYSLEYQVEKACKG